MRRRQPAAQPNNDSPFSPVMRLYLETVSALVPEGATVADPSVVILLDAFERVGVRLQHAHRDADGEWLADVPRAMDEVRATIPPWRPRPAA